MSNHNALARLDEVARQSNITPAQIDLIRSQIAPKATPDELALFLSVARSKGLDPLSKEIYAVHRGGRMTIQVGIDGYRCMAERTGEYAGNDDPVYEQVEGRSHPEAARVTVWRMIQGQRVGFSATARWSEYCQDQGGMWKKMPYLMLGKCAEALALRKAFPAALSGLYVKEELDQAGEPDRGPAEGWIDVPPPEPAPAKAESERPRRAKKAEEQKVVAEADNLTDEVKAATNAVAVRILKSECADLVRGMQDGPKKATARDLFERAEDDEEKLRKLRSWLDAVPAKKGGFAPPRK